VGTDETSARDAKGTPSLVMVVVVVVILGEECCGDTWLTRAPAHGMMGDVAKQEALSYEN